MENKEKKNKPKLTFIYYGLIIFGVIIIACLSVKNPDGEKTTPIKQDDSILTKNDVENENRVLNNSFLPKTFKYIGTLFETFFLA